MKITKVQGFMVGFDCEPPLGNARGMIRRREFLLVAIETEAGHLGWGEVFNAPWAANDYVKNKIAPLLLGRPVLDRLPLHEAMNGLLAYDRRGASRMAQSAVDMALHDAAGQVLGQSLSQMLGGALRDRVFAYASGPFINIEHGYQDYPGQVDALLGKNFRALKPRAGLSPREDGRMVRDLRRQVGDDIGLMVDVNQGYTRAAAIEAVRQMEEVGLLWIEEPLPPEDLQGYAALASHARVPLAGGEALGSLASFRELLSTNAMSVLQPDPTVCGGVTGYMQVAAIAAANDIPAIPHSFGTRVGALTSLHLAAVQPTRRIAEPADYPFVELDITANPLLETPSLAIGPDGCILLPDAPGIGLELRPSELAPWMISHWCVDRK